jgi:copper resistance protein C
MEEFMGGRVARTARAWLVVLGLVAGASVLLPPAPAAAHNSLTGSDPKNGARVATAPKLVELRFLASPAPASTRITITGPDNVPAGGAPTFAGNRVRVPFTPGAAGLYIVAYRVGSADGHPVTGEIRFTLTTGTAAAPPSATATPATAAPSTPAASPATSAVSPTPAADEVDSDGGTGWLWAVGVAVALVALGGGLLLRRRSARG